MTRCFVAIATLFASTFFNPVLAGTLKDGPSTAYVFGSDTEDEGLGFGYQATYERNRHFSVEFSGLWHEDESAAVSESIAALATASNVDLEVISLAFTGRVSFEPAPSLLVYGGGGVGYYILEVDNENIRRDVADSGVSFVEIDGDKEFGYHAAIGMEVVLTQHWEVFAEYRHVFLDSGYTVKIAADQDAVMDERRELFSYDHQMVRFGLNFRF